MSTYKTEAIVLAKRPFIEDDRFYYLYTREQGGLEVLVKAAAKSSSKLAGHLEPFAYVSTMIVRGKSKETLAGVELIKSFVVNDFASYCLASVVAETLIKLIRPNTHDEQVFQLTLKLLSFLEGKGMVEVKRLAVVKFIWQTLKFLGYWSEIDNYVTFKSWPAISSQAKELLTNKILNKTEEKFYKITKSYLKEIELYTQTYLKNVLESEIKSLALLAYA